MSNGVVTRNNETELKKQINLRHGITIIVGSIIGSGIFVSPTEVYVKCGSVGAALIVWLACGIFSMIGVYCYVELGTLITQSGGDYIYIHKAYGPFVGFLRLWVDVIVSKPVSEAIISLVFAEYVLEPFYIGCTSPIIAKKLLAAVCIVFLTFINCISVRMATWLQDILSFAKVFALIIIIFSGIVQLCQGKTSNLENLFADSSTKPGDYAMAFYAGLFAYNGWSNLNYLVGEMVDPKRDLPRALLISMVLIIVVYVLTNLAYFTILTSVDILNTKAVAMSVSLQLYGVMWWIMPAFVALSTFGGVNGRILTASRIFYVAAQHGQMPQVLAMINIKYVTPAPSVLILSFVSLVYLCFSNVSTLITYMGFVNWLAIGLGVSTVIKFRKSDLSERKIKVHLFFPILYVIASAALVVLSFIGCPIESLVGVGIILSAVPVYWVFILWKKPKCFQTKIDDITLILQKLLYIVPETKSKVQTRKRILLLKH